MRTIARAMLVFGLAPALLAMAASRPSFAADRPEGCAQVGRIVSIQGSLQIQRSGQSAWSLVRKLDTALCQGDLLHAGPRSRAAILIGPETLVRLDQRTTLSVRQTPDETLVEFAKDPGLFQTVGTTPNPCGAGYFITRFPRKFRVIAPFIDATVEGTEFLVALRCESSMLAVFEGKVLAQEVQNASSRAFSLKPGDSLEAGGPQPAAVQLLVRPVDAVQWALFYPPITDATPEAADQKCDQTDTSARAVCILQRAEERLRAGRVEEAEADIEAMLSLGVGGGEAYALLSIISVVKNDKAKALELANKATQLSPASSRAWLALSYAQQASFKLDEALAAARKAAGLAPSSSLAQARVAELLMSVGEIREAEHAARAAVKANPNDVRAHMVLGFVYLAQIDTGKARASFLAAIEINSAEPLSRLGLGLATIREGKLAEGREQIEVAVILDPANSLLRSYLGKAYYEENTKQRDQLAASQYTLAKALDPKDPTPWYYDAVLKDSESRPVDALQQVDKSTELNNERGVYRSRLLLDQDLAARTVTQGNIFNELGFSQLGLTAAAESLAADPGSPNAHRFLADIYATLPRHEIARASSLLQAQLRQPLGAQPLQAQLANDVLFKRTFFGPNTVGLNEFNPLFLHDGFALQLYGLYGDPRTYGQQIVASGLRGPVSVSVSEFSSYNVGYRPNNDDTLRQYDGFVQAQLGPSTSVQFEATRNTRTSGDLQSSFDPTLFAENLRDNATVDTYRVGLRQVLDSRSDMLFSFIQQHREGAVEIYDPMVPVSIKFDDTTWKAELQYLRRSTGFDTLVGASYFTGRSKEQFDIPAFLISETTQFRPMHFNAYSYFYLQPDPRVPQLQLGVSYDHLESDVGDQEEVNPKIGLTWAPSSLLTLRAAAFQVLKRRISSDQGLEPTQLAGFNQFFDDDNGTVAKTAGVAADLSLTPQLWSGLQYTYRSLSTPIFFLTDVIYRQQREEAVGAYVYWLPSQRVSVALQPSFQQVTEGVAFEEMQLIEVPLVVRVFLPNGLWLGGSITGVWQKGVFLGSSGADFAGSDQFWPVDASIAYRLPRRMGTISLQATNILNQQFNYQEVDLGASPRYVPERRVLLRLSLAF